MKKTKNMAFNCLGFIILLLFFLTFIFACTGDVPNTINRQMFKQNSDKQGENDDDQGEEGNKNKGKPVTELPKDPKDPKESEEKEDCPPSIDKGLDEITELQIKEDYFFKYNTIPSRTIGDVKIFTYYGVFDGWIVVEMKSLAQTFVADASLLPGWPVIWKPGDHNDVINRVHIQYNESRSEFLSVDSLRRIFDLRKLFYNERNKSAAGGMQ